MFDNVKTARKEKGLTIRDMSVILGLKAPSSYWKKEHGDVIFSLDEAKKVSIVLGKSLEELFFKEKLSLKETSGR